MIEPVNVTPPFRAQYVHDRFERWWAVLDAHGFTLYKFYEGVNYLLDPEKAAKDMVSQLNELPLKS